MGQARRRREAGERVSPCRTCTYCCDLPTIEALAKPAYRPCRHIAGGGCAIYGAPERPGACAAYRCAYLAARLDATPDRNRIPHPLDCGAYGHLDGASGAFFLFVDPERPTLWKASGLAAYLAGLLERGVPLFITDRGRQMVVRNAATFAEVVRTDMVTIADAAGRPLDVPSYAGRGKAGETSAPEAGGDLTS